MHSVQTLLRNALCELRGNLLGIKDTWAHPFTPLLSVAKVWTERISDLTALITTLCDQMGPILWGGWKRIYMRGGNRNSVGTTLDTKMNQHKVPQPRTRFHMLVSTTYFRKRVIFPKIFFTIWGRRSSMKTNHDRSALFTRKDFLKL